MTSITWPSGLERPVIPTTRRAHPLPQTVRPCDSDVLRRDEQELVPPSHLAAWCVGGSIGWAVAIGGGWLVLNVLESLVR